VLVRDEFHGKSIVNSLIDLPFALQTTGFEAEDLQLQEGQLVFLRPSRARRFELEPAA